MKKTIWAIAVLAAVVMAIPGAEGATVNGRQARQHARIREGVRSGELTRREASRLRVEQRAVRKEERLYRATGGGLSPWERRDLRRDLNRASQDIRRQKHDGQTR